mmetsp:Transcript_10777/g.44854  ORF Transcript_10777/g.44854 Transcript_10777/m.44854 type:complete len:335 (-) Transcript_10777:1690-2694(-)
MSSGPVDPGGDGPQRGGVVIFLLHVQAHVVLVASGVNPRHRSLHRPSLNRGLERLNVPPHPMALQPVFTLLRVHAPELPQSLEDGRSLAVMRDSPLGVGGGGRGLLLPLRGSDSGNLRLVLGHGRGRALPLARRRDGRRVRAPLRLRQSDEEFALDVVERGNLLSRRARVGGARRDVRPLGNLRRPFRVRRGGRGEARRGERESPGRGRRRGVRGRDRRERGCLFAAAVDSLAERRSQVGESPSRLPPPRAPCRRGVRRVHRGVDGRPVIVVVLGFRRGGILLAARGVSKVRSLPPEDTRVAPFSGEGRVLTRNVVVEHDPLAEVDVRLAHERS